MNKRQEKEKKTKGGKIRVNMSRVNNHNHLLISWMTLMSMRMRIDRLIVGDQALEKTIL